MKSLQIWIRARQLFEVALELPKLGRETYLKDAWANDPELQSLVEQLFSLYEQQDDFLETPAIQVLFDTVLAEEPEAKVWLPVSENQQIGPYRIMKPIGSGGMSTVYLAERTEGSITHQVALKLMLWDASATELLRRFQVERQILATLNHPNIVRVIDSGITERGQPYLVTDYVEGLAIDRFCNERRPDIDARLRLFRQVCDAVSHAHQNLVVHRDLKPSNILVTAEGVPKLLDFGIAKLLREGADQTRTNMRSLTPSYASPEQIKGEPIGVANDVYTLGVLLYELLTSQSPYPGLKSTPYLIAQIICESEPLPLSQVAPKFARQLTGDLDTIVLKALRKEPNRRYASVEQFSEDIRRHLGGLPVGARKDTLWYRTTKFLKRNFIAVGAGTLAIVSLLGGLGATAYQAQVARHRFEQLRKLSNSFLFEFHDAIAELPGAIPARKLVVSRALEYLDSLASEARDDESLQLELATAYRKVGDVQGYSHQPNLGNRTGAIASYRKMLAILEPLSHRSPTKEAVQHSLADGLGHMGVVLLFTGHTAEAAERCRSAVQILESLAKNHPQETRLLSDLAYAYNNLGYVTRDTDPTASLRSFLNTRTINLKLLALKPGDFAVWHYLANDHLHLGIAQRDSGELEAAATSFGKALTLLKGLLLRKHERTKSTSRLAIVYLELGVVHLRMGRALQAIADFNRYLLLLQVLVKEEPKNADLISQLSIAYFSLGDAQLLLNEPARALKDYRHALAWNERLATVDPKNTNFLEHQTLAWIGIARASQSLGNSRVASEKFTQAIGILQGVTKADPATLLMQAELANALFYRGKFRASLPKHDGAADDLQAAFALRELLEKRKPMELKNRAHLAEIAFTLGNLYGSSTSKEQMKHPQACDWYQRAEFRWQVLRNRHYLWGQYAEESAATAQEVARCTEIRHG
jgi:eukaryotic-like serine/threonine-protein kinase